MDPSARRPMHHCGSASPTVVSPARRTAPGSRVDYGSRCGTTGGTCCELVHDVLLGPEGSAARQWPVVERCWARSATSTGHATDFRGPAGINLPSDLLVYWIVQLTQDYRRMIGRRWQPTEYAGDLAFHLSARLDIVGPLLTSCGLAADYPQWIVEEADRRQHRTGAGLIRRLSSHAERG